MVHYCPEPVLGQNMAEQTKNNSARHTHKFHHTVTQTSMHKNSHHVQVLIGTGVVERLRTETLLWKTSVDEYTTKLLLQHSKRSQHASSENRFFMMIRIFVPKLPID